MDHEDWRDGQERVRIEAGDHEFDVAYREFGSGSPVTVFLHGIPTWGFLFRDVCEAVEHAVVPDLPGYGDTRHRGPGGYDRSVRAQETYVRALLDALGTTPPSWWVTTSAGRRHCDWPSRTSRGTPSR